MSALRQQVSVYIDANLAPAARSAKLAQIARAGRDDLIATGRASPYYQTFVDGARGAAEESVRPGGTILYQFGYVATAAVFALNFLRARSPVASGRYRGSFYLGVNGRFIPASQFQPKSVPPDAEIVIGNTQPYSRKIDVQADGDRPLHFSVGPGLFDDAVRATRSAFARTITAQRVYDYNFPGKYLLQRTSSRGDTHVQSPALILSGV